VLTGEMEGLMASLTDEQKAAFHPIPIELKKGYGTFHHPLLVHGSYENKSDKPRRAFVLNVLRMELSPGSGQHVDAGNTRYP